MIKWRSLWVKIIRCIDLFKLISLRSAAHTDICPEHQLLLLPHFQSTISLVRPYVDQDLSHMLAASETIETYLNLKEM